MIFRKCRQNLSLSLVFTALMASCATITPNHRLVTQGNNFAQDGMWREASESYQEFLAKVDNSNLTVHRNLGIVMVRLGSYKKAAQHLEKSAPGFDDDFETNFQLAEAYRGQELFTEAIYRYQKSLKIRPNEPRAMKALSWSYFRIRLFKESLALSTKFWKLNPKDLQIQIIRSRTLLKLGNLSEALTCLKGLDVKADYRLVPALNSAEGDIYLEARDFKKASKQYRAALKIDPMLTGALVGMAKIALQDRDLSKATDFLERALKVNPRLAEAHYLLGRLFQSSNSEKSNHHFKTFYQLAINDPSFINETTELRNRYSKAEGTNGAYNLQ